MQITGCIEVVGDFEKELVRKSEETGREGADRDEVSRLNIPVQTTRDPNGRGW